MAEIMDGTTIGAAFAAAVSAHADRPFLAVPANEGRAYLPSGFEMSYGEAGQRIEELAALYRQAGYGVGHRVATLLENRPEHVLHTLALNSIGVVLRADQSGLPRGGDRLSRRPQRARPRPDTWRAGGLDRARRWRRARHRPPVVVSEPFARTLGQGRATGARRTTPPRDAGQHPVHVRHDRPAQGLRAVPRLRDWRRAPGTPSLGGVAGLRTAADRIYNPLPLYHANAGVVSLMGAILTGNCQIQPDRFHPQRWWREVAETGATIVHYLGVIAPVLLKLPPGEHERRAQGPLRHRRRHRARAARGVREALRLSHGRALGHDRDGARAGRHRRAAPGRHPRVRPGRAGSRGPRRR